MPLSRDQLGTSGFFSDSTSPATVASEPAETACTAAGNLPRALLRAPAALGSLPGARAGHRERAFDDNPRHGGALAARLPPRRERRVNDPPPAAHEHPAGPRHAPDRV